MAEVKAQRRVMIVDFVNTNMDGRQIKMVVVQSGDAGLEILVVLQGAVAPVGTGYRIGPAA